jgi:two-component system cell cycle sensor histidine kinase/response regulator CckA
MPTDPLSGNEIQASIGREQVRLAARNVPTMQLVSFVVALLLAYSVRTVVPFRNIAAWILLILLIVTGRIIYYVRFTRVRNEQFNATAWKNVYLQMVFTSGIFWGFSSVLIFPSGDRGLISLFLLMIAGLSAATTVSHSALRLAPASWMTPALLPFAIRCFIEGGRNEYIIAILTIMYLIALVGLSLNNHATITSSIALRFENVKLLGEVRESEAGYRNLFNSINDAIYVLDENGRLLDVNKGAETMYDRGRIAMLGKTPEVLAAPGLTVLADVFAAIGKAREGEPQLIEFSGSRSDGTTFPQEVRFVPATSGGNRVVIAVARDISERKRIEAEQLRTQKVEAIGVLAGGIAHDFNNLLQAAFSYLAVAKQKIDQRDKVLLMLEKVDKALQMSSKLTNQLLTFSKGGKPVKRSLALGPAIENAARFALSGSRSDCRFDISSGLWPADADEGQLMQVIHNIVINADQAMPEGGIISVSAGNRDLDGARDARGPGSGRWIEIVVRDTGCGIPEEDKPRIFEPYFTTKKTGSGLGLATSYSIIKNHGGMIEVSSQLNAGSSFTVWLPAGGTVLDSSVRSAQPAAIRKGRVLIMDDEEVIRDSVGAMLDTLGQEVEFAEDGAAAVDRYRAALSAGSRFDVVLLDATVRGGMGGEETIRLLKEIDPSVVAVVSSGYSDNALLSNYEHHGFRASLPKPFTLEDIQTVLARLMR